MCMKHSNGSSSVAEIRALMLDLILKSPVMQIFCDKYANFK